jgi:uncharacterized delta-60 repeat protein
MAPAAGMLDPTFGVGGRVTTRLGYPSDEFARSVAIDSLGRIAVVGEVFNGTNYDFAVTRFTVTGALDTAFGGTGVVTFDFAGSDDSAYCVAVDSMNRVVVAGYALNGSSYDFAVARLTAAGVLDASFDGDGKQTIAFGSLSDQAYGVALDSQDRIVVAGTTSNGAADDFAVARLTVAGTPDSSFDGDGRQTIAFGTSDDGANGVAVDSLDRVVVAGYTYSGAFQDFAVARLTTTGVLDSSFDGDGKQTIAFGTSDDYGTAVAVDSLNRVVITGDTYNGSTTDFAVARLTAGGALDSGFDGDGKQTIAFGAPDDSALGAAVDSLDRVVVAGYTGNGSNNDLAVARLTVAGALDGSFDGDGKQTVDFGASADVAASVAIDSADRVVPAGYTNSGPSFDIALCRLTVAGALDGSFDGDGKLVFGLNARSQAIGNSVALDSLGRTVVAGSASNGTIQEFAVARYTSAGVLDTTFGGTGIVRFAFGASSIGLAVAVDSMDRVVIAGYTSGGSTTDFAVARLTSAGALDPSFDGDGKTTFDFATSADYAYAIAVDSLDRIVIAGSTFTGSNPDFGVARLTVAGALDASFDGDGKQTIAFGTFNDLAYGVAVDSIDRVVIGGYSYDAVSSDFAVVRLTAAGALDSSFDGDGKQTIDFAASDDQARGVAIDSLDRIVIAGSRAIGSNYDFAVARLTIAGAIDSSFDGDGKQTVAFGAFNELAYGVAIDSLNRVFVAGYTFNGSNGDFAVTRLTAAGALDSSFDGDGKQTMAFGAENERANGVAVSSAGQVVLAGESDNYGQVFAVARLTGDTTVAVAQVNDGSIQRSRVTSITVRFSSIVAFSGPTANAFTLVRTGGGAVNFTANVSVENGGTVVVLTNFTGSETEFGSLRDGRYTLTALASQISASGQALDGDADGAPGGNFVLGDAQGLFRFYGDINGDRHVDIADFGLFSQSIFNASNYIASFDFNGDGHIDIADFGQFAIRIFTVLP